MRESPGDKRFLDLEKERDMSEATMLKHGISRRSFLQASGVLAGAGLAGSALVACAPKEEEAPEGEGAETVAVNEVIK